MYRQFTKETVGMLVLARAEWFMAALLMSEHVSSGHSVVPISRTTNLIWFFANKHDDGHYSAALVPRLGAAAVSQR
jgi:hypothetical protein